MSLRARASARGEWNITLSWIVPRHLCTAVWRGCGSNGGGCRALSKFPEVKLLYSVTRPDRKNDRSRAIGYVHDERVLAPVSAGTAVFLEVTVHSFRVSFLFHQRSLCSLFSIGSTICGQGHWAMNSRATVTNLSGQKACRIRITVLANSHTVVIMVVVMLVRGTVGVSC